MEENVFQMKKNNNHYYNHHHHHHHHRFASGEWNSDDGHEPRQELTQSRDSRPRPRPRQPPRVPKVLPGQVAFRILCHSSVIGGIIGNYGSIISQLRRETAAKIHCENPSPGSQYGVVLVVGSELVDRRIEFEPESGWSEAAMVSGAQEAVVRVFEKIWNVEAQNELSNGSGEVWCRLVAHGSQIRAVMGKGGSNITRMRKESGAKIRIVAAPNSEVLNDEVIQIVGTVLAVKKALIAVSSCLQDHPPLDSSSMLLSKATEVIPNGSSPSGMLAEYFPNVGSLIPPMSGNPINNASNECTLTSSNGNLSKDMEDTQQEVVFRLICSNVVAGSVIGQKGSVVRALETETGASIKFAAPVTNFAERVVTISAYETLESCYSPAQNAVILVFARTVESEIEKGFLLGFSKVSTVTAKLLVASDTVGCLRENEDEVFLEVRDITGADIQILQGDKYLDYGPANSLIQITGGYKNVQHALFQVTSSLRDYLLPCEMLYELRTRSAYGRVRKSSQNVKRGHARTVGGDLEVIRSALKNTEGHRPPLDSGPKLLKKATEINPNGASPSRMLAEFFPNLGCLLPPMYGSSVNSTSNEGTLANNNGIPGKDAKGTQHEVVFRLICSNVAAGSVIGQKGFIVRALEAETGASIKFAAPVTNFGGRVVTISASETLESSYSPAQNALVLVFARTVESVIEKGLLRFSKVTTVTAKLLVASDEVYYLSGNEDGVVSEVREVTGADVQILGVKQLLDYGPANSVVQITGEYENVQNALFQVTSSLRDRLLPHEVFNDVRARNVQRRLRKTSSSDLYQSLGLCPDFKDEANLTCQMKQLGLSHSNGTSPSKLQQPQTVKGGRASVLGGDLEILSGSKLATVTNTILEIAVSQHAFGSLYGEDGCNLHRLREVQKLKYMTLVPEKVKGRLLYLGHLIKHLEHKVCFKLSSKRTKNHELTRR
ncbi:KH domain-containing protein HEN4 isoform X1 [Ziziphus jujuba]|uniref:KH domain-containing protein HEN4 isoform X1 n=1 Tax=Ziziphus jujuba TaxID=326968 RepID=A0ABM3ITD3_ZIZJJ|nr:KH domain-containing protein HEN4 isoform X1 [Ziziphus jujuba]